MAVDNNSGPDINSRLNMMQFGQGSSGGGGGSGGGIPDKASQKIEDKFTVWLNRAFGFNFDSLGIGLFSRITPPPGSFLGKMINQGAAGFSAPGSSTTNFLLKSAQIESLKDYSKLTKPAIQNPEIGGGFPVSNIPLARLGGLSPLNTGGTQQAAGIGMA